jgi:hypothetical protein
VLVCRSHSLIFVKTKKTAGTSVEAYLEVACDRQRWPGNWPDLHVRPGYIGSDVIVTERGDGMLGRSDRARLEFNGVRLSNHMLPSRIIAAFGESTWQDFLTVAGVRNPWDRLVSMFLWSQRRHPDAAALASGDETSRRTFGEFLSAWTREPMDDELHSGAYPIDVFIRYEHLADDLAVVRERAGLADPGWGMPRFKASNRDRDYTRMYDDTTREWVGRMYSDIIERFDYRFGDRPT